MLVQKKKDFLFTYKNEAEKRDRERKEKIGRKMRKKRE
jgi:hypothetical protein